MPIHGGTIRPLDSPCGRVEYSEIPTDAKKPTCPVRGRSAFGCGEVLLHSSGWRLPGLGAGVIGRGAGVMDARGTSDVQAGAGGASHR